MNRRQTLKLLAGAAAFAGTAAPLGRVAFAQAKPFTLPPLGYPYEALEPHGTWIAHRDLGYVWSPYAAEDEEDWRPYTRGHWAQTEEHGWYWVSDEPFGWATYHYGRWLKDAKMMELHLRSR